MYQTRITAAELPVERLLGEYCFPERFREACRACRTTETIGPARRGCRRRRRPCGLFGRPMCWACRYFMMHRRAGRCPRRRGLRRCAGRPMDRPSGYCWRPFWRWSRPGAGRGPSRRGGASYAPAAPGGTGCPAGMRSGCATPFPRSALIWRRWPGRELGIELLWAANGLPEYDVALAAFLER